ncbi:MAG: class I SAM-dependent methyltransferase [Actinomycetota bacterium]|nr:class I SAM-dependent methyltransferase [Actinomycetota bacterium]
MPAPPLLLHSLTEFRDLILACLDAAGARTVLEIGSESGGFTRELLRFAGTRGGEVWCVEPYPTIELEQLGADGVGLHLIAGRSPEALEGIEPCDAYIIDGDHNYWTVSRELEHALGDRDPALAPLVVLHDVSWPCGRRDQYYAPDALPPGAVHPHSWDQGSLPGEENAIRGGLRGNGSFAIALKEGGERNGVRTAVEDFVAERKHLRFAHVPSIFGVAFVYPESAAYAEALAALLDPLDANPLLERIERNRVDLYTKVIELQDAASDAGLRQGRLIAEYDRSLTAAETEGAQLRLELAKLRQSAKTS